MSISQYVIGGSALAVAVAVGYAKWTSKSAEVATGRADVAIVKAECATQNVEDTTAALNQQITDLAREVERQKLIAAAEAKKSRQRLDAFNALNRKINNVPNDQNVPVPPAVELFLDELRGAIPGSGSGADSADKDASDGAAPASGGGVPAATTPTS